MPLRGSAFLALWNDIEPERQAEYDAWHTFEHVPERVGIPGFVAARRYVAPERFEQRYFTLYELESLEALAGPGYADVVERPTDWSRRMRPSFRNTIRRPCATVLSLGLGMAGSVATLRFGMREPAQAVDADTARSALEPLLKIAPITAIHLGRESVSVLPPSMRKLGWDQPTSGTLQHVLIVEGLERRELETARPHMVEILCRRLHAIGDVAFVAFDLAFQVAQGNLPGPPTSRQPARRDLQGRWHGEEGAVDLERAAVGAAKKES